MRFSETRDRLIARTGALAVFTVCLLVVSCGGGGSSSSSNNFSNGASTIAQQVAACEATLPELQTTGLASNEASVIVDAGPCAYGVPFGSAQGTAPFVFIIGAANAPYTSVTVCMPGTSTCQTIDHVLVDTGSFGLRLMSSVLNSNMALPAVQVSGAPLFECAQFADGYAWGAVRTADVKIGGPSNVGELASGVNIEVIGDASAGTAPTACSNTGPALNDVASFFANGVLGVGLFVNDCATGTTCQAALLSTPLYYNCPSSGNCAAVDTPSANQVSDPVASFAVDKTGVVLELPPIASATGAQNVYGTLVFGIDSAAGNNSIPNSANVYVADGLGDFSASVTSAGPYPASVETCANSFIDSGSNGLFLPTSAIPTLPADSNGWFTPSTTENMDLVVTGAAMAITGLPSNQSPAIALTIANADSTLFPANGGNNTAFNDLGGTASAGGSCDTGPSGSETPSNASAGIDVGLPFFYGRPVFVANENVETTGVSFKGTNYVLPFWAF